MTTVNVDDATLQTLRDLSARSGLDLGSLLTAAVEFYRDSFADEAGLPSLTDEERASIRRGLEQSERGEGIPADELLRDLRTRFAR